MALALGASWGLYRLLAGTWPVTESSLTAVVASLAMGILGLWLGGLYRPLLHRYESRLSQLTLRPVVLASLGEALTVTIAGPPLALLTWPLFWAWLYILCLLSRLVISQLLEFALAPPPERRRKLAVYGAGSAGGQIARAIAGGHENQLVCMVDDNVDLQGRLLHGVDVVDPDRLVTMVQRGAIDVVVIAIPSASRRQRRRIIDTLSDLPVRVYSAPSLRELTGGDRQITDLREVEPDELLGREPIAPNTDLIQSEVTGRHVLISGAGGSIGSALSQLVLRYRPARLILLDSSEAALYQIDQQLRESAAVDASDVEIVRYLGSVTNPRDLRQAVGDFGAQVVYHAAAYKHVPLVESNPVAGVFNNIVGSVLTFKAAQKHGVGKFVLVSSDKAVRPTSLMGATKRAAELCVQGLAAAPDGRAPRTAVVRFGNVLDSAGSVVPVFRRQIAAGGPITVTHPDIVRFFMTIPEAAELVLQAGGLVERSGEIFHLDMGKPVRIYDLARRVIHLSGHRVAGEDSDDPDTGIAITFTGLRPGEKLYEELLVDGSTAQTRHPRIFKALEYTQPTWAEMKPFYERLQAAAGEGDPTALRRILQETLIAFDGESLLTETADQEDAALHSTSHFPAAS